MAKSAKGNRPIYNVRAKTGKDGEGRDIFATVGAAWPFNQGEGLNVKLNMLPVNFDGQLMLVPPKEEVSVLARGGNSAVSARRAEYPTTWSPARA